jgi:hypothetical protein
MATPKHGKENFDVIAKARVKLESLKQATENAVDRIIKLMVVFVLETIVLPILFIWALFGIGRSAFEMPTLRMDTGKQS